MICIPHRYYSDEQMKADEMRGASGTYATETQTVCAESIGLHAAAREYYVCTLKIRR